MTKILDKPKTARAAPAGRETTCKASVLLRVCNQVHSITHFVDRLLSAPLPSPVEVVIVDDGSTDGTTELLSELAGTRPSLRHLRHERTLGPADSLRTAVGESTGEIIVLLELDRGFNPLDLPALLRPAIEGTADVVFGSRFLSRDCRPVSWNRQTFLTRLATGISNLINGLAQSDIRPPGIVIRKDLLQGIPLREARAGLETELTAKLAKWNIRLVEVAVSPDSCEAAWRGCFGVGDFFRQLQLVLKYRYLDRQFTLHDGFHILASVGNASKFNRWMVSKLSPYFGDRILEAGSGIGNLTELLVGQDRLVCVDRDPFYIDRLRQRFGHMSNLSFHELDLNDLGSCPELKTAGLDTILCVNVLEHIEDDSGVLRSFAETLEPGGRVVLLVPANPGLYSDVDRTLGHFRRYTFEEAAQKMRDAGLEIVHRTGFNRLGAIGWFVSGRLLRRTTLSSRQMKLYEWMLPLARLIERVPFLPHLSVIVVGRKPEAEGKNSLAAQSR